MRQAWLILVLDLSGGPQATAQKTFISSTPAQRYALDPDCPSDRAYVNVTAANGATQKEARARLLAKMQLPAFAWAEPFLDAEAVTRNDLSMLFDTPERQPAPARRYPPNAFASSTARTSDDLEEGEDDRTESRDQQRSSELDEPAPA